MENQPTLASLSVKQTDFKLPNQTAFYRGKVRDVYTIGEQLIMIASDRISAFDHILPRPIPFKGQVLNQIATHFLRSTEDICPNWLVATPDENVAVGIACEPFKVEMVDSRLLCWSCLANLSLRGTIALWCKNARRA